MRFERDRAGDPRYIPVEGDLRRVSNSEFYVFRRCKRRWWLSIFRKLAKKRRYELLAVPPTVGNAVHEAMQVYYSPGPFDSDEAMREMMAYFDSLRDEHGADNDEVIDQSQSYAVRMLEGYFEWLEETGEDIGIEVESTESIVELELEGMVLSGKMDSRYRNTITGGRHFMDHKTVGDFSKIRDGIAQNEQGLTYSLIDRMTTDESERCDGGVFNMMRRVKRTAAAKPPFYDRVSINHGDETLRNFYQRVIGYIHEILRTEHRLAAGENPHRVVPPSWEDSCSWQCPFVKVCPLFDSAPQAAEDRLRAEFEERDPYERYGAITVLDAVPQEGS